MDIIRIGDILKVLKESPVYTLSELAERFVDRSKVSDTEWSRLKNNLSRKLGRLVKSGYVEIRGIGEKRRWELKED